MYVFHNRFSDMGTLELGLGIGWPIATASMLILIPLLKWNRALDHQLHNQFQYPIPTLPLRCHRNLSEIIKTQENGRRD